MQALRLKGKVEAGKLIVDEAIDLDPGEVEVIILSVVPSDQADQQIASPTTKDVDRLPATASFEEFSAWMLKDMSSFPQDFDPEDAKWRYLKEKHNL